MAGFASAGELSRVGNVLRYTEASSDPTPNDVGITFCDPDANVDCDAGDPGPYYLVTEDVDPGIVTSPTGACAPWSVDPDFWKCASEGVERWEVSLGGGNDQFRFQSSNFNTLTVPAWVAGDDGDDELDGTLNRDVLDGGAGDDLLFALAGEDVLQGGPGDDILSGDEGNDLFDGGLGSDWIMGGSPGDVVTYADRTEGVTVNLGVGGRDDGSALDGPAGARDEIVGITVVIGGRSDDELNGNALSTPIRLRGGPGNDVLSGGLGPNTLFGQTGNDELNGSDDIDVLSGGTGNDELDGHGDLDMVSGDAGRDSVEGRDGNVDDLDCGSEVDSALTDAVDLRTSCEPSTTITQKPPKTTGARTATFKFTSTTPGVRFQCRLDGGNWVVCNSGTKMYTGLSRTQHTFRVRARDLDGTADPTPAIWTWRVT